MDYKRDTKLFNCHLIPYIHIHFDKPLFKTYWNYVKYVFKHKYYVMRECFKEGLLLQGIVHDISKLYPSEFHAYAIKFYSGDYAFRYLEVEENFKKAWISHYSKNKHHWNYWLLSSTENDKKRAAEMPYKYMKEMLCDWRAMGITQGNGIAEYYSNNKDKIVLHPHTRMLVEKDIFLEHDYYRK